MGNQQLITEQNSRRHFVVILALVGALFAGLAFADLQTASTVTLTDLVITDHGDSTRLAIQATDSLVWLQYRDAEGRLVIDLPNSEVGDLTYPERQGLVLGLEVDAVDNQDRPLTRLIIDTAPGTESEIEAIDDLLAIRILPAGGESPAVVAEAKPLSPSPLSLTPRAQARESAGTADMPLFGPAPSGVEATRLDGVQLDAHGSGMGITVLGDGEFRYSSFVLDDPPRFVLDLHGVVNLSGLGVLPSGAPGLEGVRVAQFQSHPNPVSRVVLDLERPSQPTVQRLGAQLLIQLQGADSTTQFAESQGEAPQVVVQPPAMSQHVVASLATPVTSTPSPEPYNPVVEEAISAGQKRASDDASSGSIASDASRPSVSEADLWEEELVTAAPVTPASLEITRREPSNVSRYEATQTRDDMAQTSADAPDSSGFDALEVDNGTSRYVGAPISFSLRDGDIKEVLRTFAKLGGLNMVVQPGVSGSVTVELDEVPWDQALEQILKINGLGYELEGNIMRVAPRAQLAREAQQEAQRQQAIASSQPLKTVMKRISYSSAKEIADLLDNSEARILSTRGRVAVDGRTNTIIIKELPDFMDAALAVIDQIDVPEPQVMIEARIVETTKEFSRSLGVSWGFNQTADAAHANTTGLSFPNEVTSAGGVNLLTGGANGFLGVSMANILDTFSLDASLQAAEQEGLVNILSAPKIATLNNASASIQSGLQIPIQTVSNNTVSVQFVNATLKLDVTPHVTADGTVLMDINVQKREPQLAFLVSGATNAPISTKEARTRVIVRDGGTTVIGGIYKVTNDRGQDRVPGLANIPILGHLFKNRRDSNQNDELLIFITPRVIKL